MKKFGQSEIWIKNRIMEKYICGTLLWFEHVVQMFEASHDTL